MKELAELAMDQPLTGLQRAVWWTEYVLRHNDTTHLKAPWATSEFHHEFHLDVVAVLSTALLLITIALFKLCNTVLRVVVEICRKEKSVLMHCTKVGFRILINKVAK